jgi:Holliday junction resolvasome RuvABC endonuclease subunit
MIFVGIDPGASGGIALVGSIERAYKMPESERDLWDLLTNINEEERITYALIEQLHALPAAVEEKLGIKRGSIATAKLMQHYGSLRMALIGQNIPFEERIPRTWQKLMGLPAGGGKNASKARAQQLFPHIKVTHAIADALLIACTARILWMNSNPQPKVKSLGPFKVPNSDEQFYIPCKAMEDEQ